VKKVEAELKVEFVGLMGQGVARDGEGNQYFVPGGIPGDRVRVSFEETEKRYRDAVLEEVLEPSADRVEPACPKFTDCGGCDWMHWKYSAQLSAKQQILDHVLTRGQWMPEKVMPAKGAEKILGYRNRIQLHRDRTGVGFFKRKTHEIVDIDTCLVADPRLNEALKTLREETHSVETRSKVEVAVTEAGEIIRLDNQPHAAAGFAQVHEEQNQLLRKMVSAAIIESGAKSVLELYSGNGNLTHGYASQVEEVFCIDSSTAALEQARARFEASASPRIAFLERKIDSKLRRSLPRDFKERYDTLLLDPPRSGAEACIEPLIHPGLKTIVYVSCSPVAFTKDISCLKEHFRFDSVQLIDMFPQTRHIEFVAVFSRLLS
jgi:23S rRNA (uracil1939-C5)-methyltransferase